MLTVPERALNRTDANTAISRLESALPLIEYATYGPAISYVFATWVRGGVSGSDTTLACRRRVSVNNSMNFAIRT
jgi:hypothetical protein